MQESIHRCMGCMEDTGGASKCPECGFEESSSRSSLILPYRTVLHGRFLVGRVLGRPGGFGTTYLAWDSTLDSVVAIKEFLPSGTVSRDTETIELFPHCEEDKETFEEGKQEFLNEARTLVKFSHSNIVRVRDFFTENNTAYLVMDYYQGVSLNQYMKSKHTLLSVTEVMDIMMPILDGLQMIHQQGYLHRDIKPGNIYLTRERHPILLDFGSARQALGEKTQTMSVILSPGYAPFEQYHKRSKQGPWTDIYGCAATMYYLLTGKAPPDALERNVEDALEPPHKVVEGVNETFSYAILLALSQQQEYRPQSVEAFKNLLLSEDTIELEDLLEQTQSPTSVSPQKSGNASIGKYFITIVVVCLLAVLGYFVITKQASDDRSVTTQEGSRQTGNNAGAAVENDGVFEVRRRGAPPPPEMAITACEKKKQGSVCNVTAPDGGALEGLCTMVAGYFACLPDSHIRRLQNGN